SQDTTSNHDISVAAGDTTVVADTPITNEGFIDLSIDAESEIIREEINQVDQVEGGVLLVSSEQSQESTTLTVTDHSGTTHLDASASIDSSATSTLTHQYTDTTLNSTTSINSDATVNSDVGLLAQTQSTTQSLIVETTADPLHTTA